MDLNLLYFEWIKWKKTQFEVIFMKYRTAFMVRLYFERIRSIEGFLALFANGEIFACLAISLASWIKGNSPIVRL